ncbi:MAG: LysR family transcriptional regulator, partial [Alphaproteobacteria bacterium]|nr:LysR family transcriptional regulator [Alphaproteobacteria bacterium]
HEPEVGDLIQGPLLRNETGLYASEEYLKEFGVPKIPKDLDNHRLISYGDHLEAKPFKAMNWHLTLGTELGEIREPFLQINCPQARVFLAKAGLGIIALSKEHPGLKELDLIQILPDIPAPSVETYYIYPKEFQHSKKVIALRDYLQEAFARDYGNGEEDSHAS